MVCPEEDAGMSFGLVNIEYPEKIFDDIKKGRQIELVEIAKTGMVISFYTDDLQYYNDFNLIFQEHCSKKLAFVDLEQTQKQFERVCEIWRNSRAGNLDVETIINLFSCVCIVKELFINQKNQLLFHEALTIRLPSRPELGESHFSVYSTHEDLIKNKINQYWQKLKLQINNHFKTKKQNTTRNRLPKGIRHEVFKKDNFRCVWCGKNNTITSLEIDHIIPIAKGGTDELSNLRTLCVDCNRNRGDLLQGVDKK